MKSQLSKAVTRPVIQRLAGEEAYERGSDYFVHGHVISSEQHGDALTARVRGAKQYTVELNVEDGILDYECDCPAGREGNFCKHCVAAALDWLKQASGKKTRPAKRATLAEAAKILQSQERDALVALIMDWAKEDAHFRERVLIYASKQLGPEAAIDAIRAAFDKAARFRGHMKYREAKAYARRVAQAIDPIEQVLKDGRAAAAIDLAESALNLLLSRVDRIDDSDGYVQQQLERLADIHFDACEEAHPEPRKLARSLFTLEMNSVSELFDKSVLDYADVLGEEGIKAYREIAEAAWAKVPQRTEKDRWSDSLLHYKIRQIMDAVAELSGDDGPSVEVLARDLSAPHNYLELAEAHSKAGNHDEALRIAKKGMNAFPDADQALADFVACEYHRRGQHDEAMRLFWDYFRGSMHFHAYLNLIEHAKKANAEAEWRERALREIRDKLARDKAKNAAEKFRSFSWFQMDSSLLVEILLYEKRVEEAWREAHEGGCRYSLWMRLAKVREQDHPDEAAAIYLKHAQLEIARAPNSRYDAGVDLLVKAAAVMNRAGRRQAFIAELNELRQKYSNRPNFQKLIEQRRNELYLSGQPA